MNKTPMMIRLAEKPTRASNLRVKIGADFDLGGLRMTSRLTGSTPNDCAGGPSIKTLT